MDNKQSDVLAILKLYELRRDEAMRRARAWYFTEFDPTSGMDIVRLTVGGERESANYRMVTSYWDMAASLVNNNAIDAKLFLDANTEHIFVFAKIQLFLAEVRQIYGEPDYLLQLEEMVLKIPDVEAKLENRRQLTARWMKKTNSDK